MPIRDHIIQVVRGQDIQEAQAAEAMDEIMSGIATPAQIAAFLTALHMKGETEAEIAGMARVMREKATAVEYSGDLLDTCGTGGDASGTFNISTTSAFVAAGAGALGLALGGPARYHGEWIVRPVLGEGLAPRADDIGRAIALVRRSLGLWLAVGLIVGVIFA